MARHAMPPPRSGGSEPEPDPQPDDVDAAAVLAAMIDRSSLGSPVARVDRMNGATASIDAATLVAGQVVGDRGPSAIDVEWELARLAGERGDAAAVDLAHRTILAEPISNRTWALQREVATRCRPDIHVAWLETVAGHRERSLLGQGRIVAGGHPSISNRPGTLLRRLASGAAAVVAVAALLSALLLVKAHQVPPLWLVYVVFPLAATFAVFLFASRRSGRPPRACRTMRRWSSEAGRRVDALAYRVDALQDVDREILGARITTRRHRHRFTGDGRQHEAEVLGSVEDRFDRLAARWGTLIEFAGWGRRQADVFARRCEVADAAREAGRGLQAELALMRVASLTDPITTELERIQDEAGQFGLMSLGLDFADLIEEARSVLGMLVAECEATMFAHGRLYRLAALVWLTKVKRPRRHRAYVRWAMSLTTGLPFLSWSAPSVRCAAFVELAAEGVSIRRVGRTILAVFTGNGPAIDSADFQAQVDEMVGVS